MSFESKLIYFAYMVRAASIFLVFTLLLKVNQLKLDFSEFSSVVLSLSIWLFAAPGRSSIVQRRLEPSRRVEGLAGSNQRDNALLA